jgi:hypothetical protein
MFVCGLCHPPTCRPLQPQPMRPLRPVTVRCRARCRRMSAPGLVSPPLRSYPWRTTPCLASCPQSGASSGGLSGCTSGGPRGLGGVRAAAARGTRLRRGRLRVGASRARPRSAQAQPSLVTAAVHTVPMSPGHHTCAPPPRNTPTCSPYPQRQSVDRHAPARHGRQRLRPAVAGRDRQCPQRPNPRGVVPGRAVPRVPLGQP